MIDKIFSIVSKSAERHDDDFADKINYRFTSSLLAMGAFLITWYTAFGDVIQCWTPTYFAGAWIDYANNLCFIKNTYYLPMDIPIEKGREERLAYSITYYQWIPLFFMWLAMCFYIPRAVWYNVFSHHFVDINAIVDLLTSFDNAVNPETRDPAVQQVAKHIHRYLCNSTEYRDTAFFEARKSVSKKCKTFAFYIGRRYGLQVTLIYLIIKCMYITVGITQLYWIDSFLRGSDAQNWTLKSYYANIFTSSYVYHVLASLVNGTNWENSPTFPRVTMCDFETRALGQNQKFSIQCVLPINLFNEKIFLFLYCWIMMVVLITCTNLFLWIYRIAFAFSRQKYIMKHLTLMGRIDERNRRYSLRVTKRLIRVFIHDYLRPDGVFLLRLIAINTNCLIASEIIANLWDEFRDDEKTVKKAETYNIKYRQKYGSDTGGTSLAGSGIGNDDTYSTSQEKVIIKRRSQKSFSIFQPSLDDSQITPSSNMPKELSDLRKFQNSMRPEKLGNGAPKVGFHEPGPNSGPTKKKKKQNSFFVCIDCDDADNESDYGINMIDPPARPLKSPKTKKDSFGAKVKNFFVYDSSASESDLSDDAIQAIPASPKPKRKRARPTKVLKNCLSIEDPNTDDDGNENKGPGSVRSANTSGSQGEHRQDSVLANPRFGVGGVGGPRGPFESNGVQPPAYSQGAGFSPLINGIATVESPRPRPNVSYVPSVIGL
ncbi:innexin unc-9-like isoform X2 [Convolutriloba macropyga]|uniref:innexin unc-9-like isoform X2 n=1 Tax=Convolutriloba macropyga TaxID=536237 RepID=UPI003F5276CD